MKRHIYLYLFSILSVLFTACSGMDEEYKEFLNDSDILYPGRVIPLSIFTGIERVKFDLLLSSDPKVKKIIVYWDSRQQSKEFEIKDDEIGGMKEIELFSMDEGHHIFEFITYDMNNRASVPTEVIAQVYGDKYRKKITNRNILSAVHTSENEVTLKWEIANNLFADVRVEVQYEGVDGRNQLVIVPKDDLKTILSDYKEGKMLKIITYIKPDTSCLDEYKTELKNCRIDSYYDELKVNTWKVIDVSEKSDRPQNPAINCIDGDYETLMHSNGGSTFPHHITFDAGSKINISGFYVVQRWTQPTQQAKDMTIYASETGEKDGVWTEVTSHILLQVSKQTQDQIPLSKVLSTRYFKFVFETSWEKNIFTLNEIGAYTEWQ